MSKVKYIGDDNTAIGIHQFESSLYVFKLSETAG